MKSRTFLDAVILRMASILAEHGKNESSPDSIYSDTEIVAMLEELIDEITKHNADFAPKVCGWCSATYNGKKCICRYTPKECPLCTDDERCSRHNPVDPLDE